jgi:hypothetical protein
MPRKINGSTNGAVAEKTTEQLAPVTTPETVAELPAERPVRQQPQSAAAQFPKYDLSDPSSIGQIGQDFNAALEQLGAKNQREAQLVAGAVATFLRFGKAYGYKNVAAAAEGRLPRKFKG